MFLKEIFEKVNFEKSQQTITITWKIDSGLKGCGFLASLATLHCVLEQFTFIPASTQEDLSQHTGLRSAVGNVSGYRCVSDCRSRGREFDPGPVPYFHGDWSWNNFYGHSPSFRWFIQEGLLSVTSESMCTNYWLTAYSSLPRKKCS